MAQGDGAAVFVGVCRIGADELDTHRHRRGTGTKASLTSNSSMSCIGRCISARRRRASACGPAAAGSTACADPPMVAAPKPPGSQHALQYPQILGCCSAASAISLDNLESAVDCALSAALRGPARWPASGFWHYEASQNHRDQARSATDEQRPGAAGATRAAT